MMSDESIREAKGRLRTNLLELRSQVGPDQIEASSMAVWKTLQALPAYAKTHCIAGISSFRNEIDTFRILDGVLRDHKRLCLPRISGDKTHLTFHEITSLQDLTPGTYGILEPPPHRATPLDQLDLVIVPGLAFDRTGNRLGFGKGYYDKVLPRLRRDALSIGLCYSFQVVEAVPYAGHDVPVHSLLTDTGFTLCQ